MQQLPLISGCLEQIYTWTNSEQLAVPGWSLMSSGLHLTSDPTAISPLPDAEPQWGSPHENMPPCHSPHELAHRSTLVAGFYLDF